VHSSKTTTKLLWAHTKRFEALTACSLVVVDTQVDVKMHDLLQQLWNICRDQNSRDSQARVEKLLTELVDLSQATQWARDRLATLEGQQLAQQSAVIEEHEAQLDALQMTAAELQLRRSDPDDLTAMDLLDLQRQHEEMMQRKTEVQRMRDRALQAARRAGDRIVQEHKARLSEQQMQQVEQQTELRGLVPELAPTLLAACKGGPEQSEEL
jgi:hypothetical protein